MTSVNKTKAATIAKERNEDDWDLQVPASRSFDTEQDPVASARDAFASFSRDAAIKAAAAKTAAYQTKPASSPERTSFNLFASCQASSSPPAWRPPQCMPMFAPAAQCASKSTIHDDVYFGSLPSVTSSSASLEQREEEEEENILFAEPEPPDLVQHSPMRSQRRIMLERLPADSLEQQRTAHPISDNASVGSDSSSLPPPPPPTYDYGNDLYTTPEIVEELVREVSSIQRITTFTIPNNPEEQNVHFLSMLPKLHRKSDKRVRFSDPIVTSLKHRPATTFEERADLYFSHDELIYLEMDRESIDIGDEFQVEVRLDAGGKQNNNKHDQISISHHGGIWRNLSFDAV